MICHPTARDPRASRAGRLHRDGSGMDPGPGNGSRTARVDPRRSRSE
ncbi:hypothetical protein HMPREF0569_2070 [Micrococcus luteus SK58]|nr:hypothetical protein HMPREF0569_2070 [Micrococcus luteus SK58]